MKHVSTTQPTMIGDSCQKAFFFDAFSSKESQGEYVFHHSLSFDCGNKGHFTFTGKGPRKGWRTLLNTIICSEQRDAETGLSYFGARYYDSYLLMGWLSVDPMADKYPSITPYAYCAWNRPTGGHEHRLIKSNLVNNSMRQVDPDGRDVWEVSEDGHVKKVSEEGGTKRQTVRYSNGQITQFHGAKYHHVMYDLSKEDDNIVSASYGNCNMQSVYAKVFLYMADNTNVEWRMDRYSDGHYALGTLHNPKKSPSSYELSGGEQNDKTTITLIHSHPMASGYPSTESIESQKSSMGYWGKKGMSGDVWLKRNTSLANAYYYTYFPRTHQLWSVVQKDPLLLELFVLIRIFSLVLLIQDRI